MALPRSPSNNTSHIPANFSLSLHCPVSLRPSHESITTATPITLMSLVQAFHTWCEMVEAIRHNEAPYPLTLPQPRTPPFTRVQPTTLPPSSTTERPHQCPHQTITRPSHPQCYPPPVLRSLPHISPPMLQALLQSAIARMRHGALARAWLTWRDTVQEAQDQLPPQHTHTPALLSSI